MFALSLTAGTEGFLKAIFDAVILPLVDILIYLLVLLLVILIGMGFIMRMVAVLMWTMPLAMELTLGPVVSNMLCALLTFCLRITVSDGVSETITKLMDALLMGALAQAISMVAGPAITHKIVALSTKPLTFAAARSITTDLTHAVTHGLTHSVTHAIIHKYYCQVSTRRPAPPIAAPASSTSHTLPLLPSTVLLLLPRVLPVLLLLQRLHLAPPAVVHGRHRAHAGRPADRQPVWRLDLDELMTARGNSHLSS